MCPDIKYKMWGIFLKSPENFLLNSRSASLIFLLVLSMPFCFLQPFFRMASTCLIQINIRWDITYCAKVSPNANLCLSSIFLQSPAFTCHQFLKRFCVLQISFSVVQGRDIRVAIISLAVNVHFWVVRSCLKNSLTRHTLDGMNHHVKAKQRWEKKYVVKRDMKSYGTFMN